MIYAPYLESILKDFCALKDIPIFKGCIPQEYVREAKWFVSERMRKEREITKRLEETEKMKIKATVKELLFHEQSHQVQFHKIGLIVFVKIAAFDTSQQGYAVLLELMLIVYLRIQWLHAVSVPDV